MNNEKILRTFSKFEIKSYIDATIKSLEFSVIRNELYSHEKIKKEIDGDLFKTFLLNTDHLIDILERTDFIAKKIKQIKSDLADYKTIFSYFEDDEQDEDCVDLKKRDNLRKLLNEFRSDCSVFLTPKRYLVFYDVLFSDEDEDSDNSFSKNKSDENEYVGDKNISIELSEKLNKLSGMKRNNNAEIFILIFTNDLLIIGKRIKGMFEVRNAFSLDLVKMEMQNEMLVIDVNPLSYIFYKSQQDLVQIMNIYKEINYKSFSNEKLEDKNNRNNEENDFHDFLRETEQFEVLIHFKGSKKNVEFMVDDVQGDDGNLFLILQLIDNEKERISFFFEYLNSLFKKKLDNITPVQKFNNFIDEIYSVFFITYEFNKSLFKEYIEIYDNSFLIYSKFVIFLESQILYTFKLLGKRIFGKYGNIKGAEEYIKKVRRNLSFDNYNFEYLLERFKGEKEKMKEKTSINIKLQILKIVESMV